LPISDVPDTPGDAAGETDAGEPDDAALDALFDDGDDASEADGPTDDVVGPVDDEDASDEAAPEAEGLDEMLAAPAEDEAPIADPAPDADEEEMDLDALMADDGPEESSDDGPEEDGDDTDAAAAGDAPTADEGDKSSEDLDAGTSAEAPTLDALVGDEPGQEEEAADEAPRAETPDETVDSSTGLLTPESFADRLGEDWATAEASDLPMSLILVDIARIAGDGDGSAATEVARVLSGEFGAVGTPAHADEHLLALVLTNVPLDEAIEVAGLAQTALGGALPDSSESIALGVSERRGSRAEDAAEYLRSLREAMDEGVAAGQNFVVYG
jgi:GGDEF domain-containing protein